MKKCFFCGEAIIGKSNREHIYPDALLGRLSLKNESISLNNGNAVTYSRLKVDSHKTCNNEFGSRYEQSIINILTDLDSHQADLSKIHSGISIQCPPSESVPGLLSTWFMKLYYGMIWFSANLKSGVDGDYTGYHHSLLDDYNFRLLQKSYQMGKAFNLPSSLYYLKLNNVEEMPFEQGMMHNPPTYWMKIHEHFFMISIGDGQLTYNYINDDLLSQIQATFQDYKRDPLFFLLPLSHLIAVRRHIPKSPKFIIGEDSIINMSTSTLSTKTFHIDEQAVNREAERTIKLELLPRFGSK